MNEKNEFQCIDAGTLHCPCYLAMTGDCLTCSRLQGKDCSQCNWKGVCIYNEFIQGNKKINNARKNFEADIIEVKEYKDNLIIFKLNVGRGFALKCTKPGTYVFVGNPVFQHEYMAPISITKADTEGGIIHLAIKLISTKTKGLMMAEEKLLLRGPYGNGIQGTIGGKNGSSMEKERILIVTKGIGIAPGIHTAHYGKNRSIIDFIVDTEKIDKELVEEYLIEDETLVETMGSLQYINLSQATSYERLKRLMAEGKYHTIMILASDYYVETLSALAKAVKPEANIGVSNNVHICCGEGLCGACAVTSRDGEVIKMCKCHMDKII